MTASVAPALTFDRVTFGYEGHPAVHHLAGTVTPGTLLAVIGPNGSGKSTLLKGLVGALRPLEGHIDLDGLARQDIAYLPQQADIDRSFPITVSELVAMGLWRKVGAWRTITAPHRETIARAISSVGLEGFEKRTLDTLSGGQLQRALFARVLTQDSPLILLDEPLNAIDNKTAADLIALIHRWHNEKRTVIAVLHDLDLVKEQFPQALLLARRTIAWGATGDVVTPANLLRARSMSESWDETAPWCSGAAPH
jgi:zinc/manganese transport system ATP-binding protein